MINFCYTGAIIGQNNSPDARNYAAVTVYRGRHGYALPSRGDLYFTKYDDAQRRAEEMNEELGLDAKECALLAIECMARGY